MRSYCSPVVLLMCLVFCTGLTVPAATAQSPAVPAPTQPLRAWTLSLDGTVLVVDAENRLYRLGVTDLAVEARSKPLLESVPEDRLFLAAGYTQVFVGSESTGQTLVLDMVRSDSHTRQSRSDGCRCQWQVDDDF